MSVSDDLADTHDVFACYDTRGDDRIAVTQIGDVLRALGQAPTQADIVKCSEQWPMHDRRITFEEFVPIYKSLQRKHDAGLSDKFIEALSTYDDGNGVVNTMELRNLLSLKGEPLTEKELNQLLAGHEDSTGNVNISDLVRMVMQ